MNSKVNRNRFDFINIIGKGGFGKVWKVIDKKTKKVFALKEMSKVRIIDKKSERSVLYERELLSRMKNPFIVNMHYAFQDFDNLYLIMDLLSGGDLRYHICRHRRFSEEQTRFFSACIIISLEYIHSKHIIHRDIKPENLVMDDKGYIRITDFGIAKVFSNKNSHETSGTPGYMAPEVMNGQNHTFLVDYFALGVIIYELMLGKRPYVGKNRKEIKEQMMSKQIYIKIEDIPEGWSEEAVNFINGLLTRKAEKRLGAKGIKELKNHVWLKYYPWNELEGKNIKAPFIPEKRDNYDKKYCNSVDKIGIDTKERYEQYKMSTSYSNYFVNFTFYPIHTEIKLGSPKNKFLYDSFGNNNYNTNKKKRSSHSSNGIKEKKSGHNNNGNNFKSRCLSGNLNNLNTNNNTMKNKKRNNVGISPILSMNNINNFNFNNTNNNLNINSNGNNTHINKFHDKVLTPSNGYSKKYTNFEKIYSRKNSKLDVKINTIQNVKSIYNSNANNNNLTSNQQEFSYINSGGNVAKISHNMTNVIYKRNANNMNFNNNYTNIGSNIHSPIPHTRAFSLNDRSNSNTNLLSKEKNESTNKDSTLRKKEKDRDSSGNSNTINSRHHNHNNNLKIMSNGHSSSHSRQGTLKKSISTVNYINRNNNTLIKGYSLCCKTNNNINNNNNNLNNYNTNNSKGPLIPPPSGNKIIGLAVNKYSKNSKEPISISINLNSHRKENKKISHINFGSTNYTNSNKIKNINHNFGTCKKSLSGCKVKYTVKKKKPVSPRVEHNYKSGMSTANNGNKTRKLVNSKSLTVLFKTNYNSSNCNSTGCSSFGSNNVGGNIIMNKQ